MDFLENVKRALNDTAKTVTKASGDAVEKVKIKYSIYDMNTEIKQLLGEIGLEVYKSYKDSSADLNDIVLDKCREIDQKNEQIEEAEAKLAESKKDNDVCTSCGGNIPKGCVYCPKCGVKLGEDGEVTVTITEE